MHRLPRRASISQVTRAAALVTLLGGWAVAACVPGPGARGAPCDDEGGCDGSLVCLQGTCLGEGDAAAAIPIAFLAPSTGAFTSLGQGQLEAMRMALDDVNQAGGVLGRHLLRPLIVDTGAVPETASDVARSLADVENVIAFVGPGTSPEAIAVAAVAGQRRLPLVSPSAGSSLLSADRLAGAPFFFRTGPSDDERGAALAALAGELGCADALIVRRDDPYGAVLSEAFAIARPGVEQRTYPPTPAGDDTWADVAATLADDARPAIAVARAPLCIVLVAYPEDAAAIATALLPSLPQDALLLVPDLLDDPLFIGALGPAAARVHGVAPALGADDALGPFAEAFLARFGSPPTPAAAAAYDAVALVALALESARSTFGARIAAELIDSSSGGARVVGGGALIEPIDAARAGDDFDYAGPSGEVDLDELGEANPPLTTWTIVDGEVVVAPPTTAPPTAAP